MTAAEHHYFALLQTALWGAPVAVSEELDWDAVMGIAKHHGNNVLLSDVAVRMTEFAPSSPEMVGKMQLVMRSNLLNQMQLKQILAMAVKLLRQHEIEPVLLKGFSLAMLYPNPSLRQFGDIDLFIGLEKFHEACKLLRTLPGCYNWGEETDEGKHYNIEFGPHPMEIHRVSVEIDDAKENKAYAAIEHEGLVDHAQCVNLDGLEVSIPSKEFMVFFTFFHAWHHFLTSGVGWRQLSDVAMTLHAYHGQLDLEKLRGWIETMHLMQPWQTFGFLMVDCLGLPETEMPFFNASCRRRAKRLYRQIMREGNFKRENRFRHKKPKQRILRKIHSFLGVFADFSYRARVFPSNASRELFAALKHGLERKSKK